eukprot:TRINITY_DN173_c0_g1_i11.p1 TRINITY_DN173_c0_g1~~TRINITY_DN173_c0_g1_i11.p1  ORF type:complete len:394 (+),score=39.06 TRINITY_DN173_c0_g1_i11:78-1259(+)
MPKESCTPCQAWVTIVIALFAMVWTFSGPLSGYWSGYSVYKSMEVSQKTYEQQYPAFETVAETLQYKFHHPPSLSCTDAVLQHPLEGVVEKWINLTWARSDSLHLLFYGEAMLGKSCTIRKVLDKLARANVPFFYHTYQSERGFDGFVKDMCAPAVVGPDKLEAFEISMRKYADLVRSPKRNNALLVIDFATTDLNGLRILQTYAKVIHHESYPVRFVFVASEAQAPTTFQASQRIEQVRLTESDDTLARAYLQQYVGIQDEAQLQEITQFTGSIFKYLSEVRSMWPQDRPGTDADVQAAKKAVFSVIERELGHLLEPRIYPEVVEICKQLIQHNTLSLSTIYEIAETNTKGSEGFQKRTEYILSQNLFLVDQGSGTVSFQNRATASFMTEYL